MRATSPVSASRRAHEATSSSSVRNTICGSPAERPRSSSRSGFTDGSSSRNGSSSRSGMPSPPAARTSARRVTSTWARSPVTSSATSGAVGESEPSASTSRRSREASSISSRLASAHSTGMSPASCCHSARAGPAGTGHVHERLAAGVVGEQAVDPLELEARGSCWAPASASACSSASAARPTRGAGQEGRGDADERRWPRTGARRRRPGRRPGMVSAAQAPPMQKVRLRVVSNRSAACSTAMWRASTSSIMAASSGADPMASASDVRSPSARRSASAAAHTRRWSRAARTSTAWPRLRAGGQVGGAEAHQAAGGTRVEAELGEQVAAAVGVGELGGHVAGAVDVDDAVPAARGPEHGEVPTAALLELEVQPGRLPPEGADELADEALALDPSHPGHDGQPGVEIEGQGVLPGLDDQTFHAHGWVIGATERDLKQDLGQTAHVKPAQSRHTSGPRRCAPNEWSDRGARPVLCRSRSAAGWGRSKRPLSSVGRAQPW